MSKMALFTSSAKSESHHHNMEETGFFPEVEKITGVTGIMERNLEQHQVFTPALERFEQYLKACLKEEKAFDAKEFTGLINAFAPALCSHLKDEIETLYGLGEYDTGAVKRSYMSFAADAQKQDKARPVSHLRFGCYTLNFL